MQTESVIIESANGHGAESTPAARAAADGSSLGIAREFQDFVADMQDLLQATTSLTGEDLARAKANLQARIASAKAFVEDMPGVISDQARDTAQVADGYVRKQPWQAIGITAALGLLIGFLAGRRGS